MTADMPSSDISELQAVPWKKRDVKSASLADTDVKGLDT